jgi:trans-aconitate 2-methyltransferase
MKYLKMVAVLFSFGTFHAPVACAVDPVTGPKLEIKKEPVQATLVWEDYWTAEMVKQYAHYSNPQRRWAWAILAKRHFRGDENVLDIGSADGHTAADLSKLIPNGKMIGVDSSPKMVDWANKQYHPRDYPNLNFRVGEISNLDPQEKFDIILAFFTLAFSPDPTQALVEMKSHLKASGKILISVPAEGHLSFTEAMKQTRMLPKWKKYETHSSSRRRASADDYLRHFSEAGLRANKIEKINTVDPFVDKDEFIGWIKLILPPGFKTEAVKNEFCSDVIDKYVSLRKDAMNDEGVYFGHFNFYAFEVGTE